MAAEIIAFLWALALPLEIKYQPTATSTALRIINIVLIVGKKGMSHLSPSYKFSILRLSDYFSETVETGNGSIFSLLFLKDTKNTLPITQA